MSTRGDAEKRKHLRQKYGALVAQISAILFRADPLGIADETNTDEYDQEAGTILPRLEDAKNALDAQHIIHEEFGRWFGVGEVGPFDAYGELALAIWTAWTASSHGAKT